MAPKTQNKCLRCPSHLVDDYKHKDLAKCFKSIKVDAKPYTLNDLWPDFNGTETVDHGSTEEAKAFIEQVSQELQAGEPQPWSKDTMERAAEEALKADQGKKEKQQNSNLASSLVSAVSGLAVKHPVSSPVASKGVRTPAASTWIHRTQGLFRLQRWSHPLQVRQKQQPRQPQSLQPRSPAPDQPQDTNQAAVLDYIDGLAGRLANLDHANQQRRDQVPQSKRTQLSNLQRDGMKQTMKQKFGLRTGFTTRDQDQHVEANYLEMKHLPKHIYVYDVVLVRQYLANGSPVLVQKQWDKLEILHEIMRAPAPGQPASAARNAICQALQNNVNCWATDGSLIWSTVGLFNAQQPNQSAAPIAPAAGPALRYQNETGNMLTILRVDIAYRHTINLATPVGDLFFDTAASSYRGSAPDILSRGLNAFFTKFVGDRSDPPRPTITGNHLLPVMYTRVGLNKSYPVTGGFPLDRAHNPAILCGNHGFFLSVRPGVDRIYINISSATSPFLQHGISVQDYIQRCISAAHNRSNGEVSAILKGIKVRIRYNTTNTAATFPNTNSRFRFIKGIASPGTTANVSQRRWPNLNCVTAQQWYTGPYWRQASEFPVPQLTLGANEYFVNVGKDPRVNNGDDVEWYPARALIIEPWQPFPARLSGDQTSNMIRQALRPPAPHRANLLSVNQTPPGGLFHFAFGGPRAGANQGGLAAAQLSTATTFLQVPARWLTTPGMRYSAMRVLNNTATDAHNAAAVRHPNILPGSPASWNLNGLGFARPETIRRVPVLALINTLNRRAVGAALRDQLRRHGCLIRPTIQVPVVDQFAHIAGPKLSAQWETNFSQALTTVNGTPRQTVLVIMPAKCFDDYACIKRVGDLRMGIHTVCVTATTAQRMPGGGGLQASSNVAMKFNIKAGGDIHHFTGTTLNALKAGRAADTIVLGADVTHPSDASTKATPSIAAVVGSIDDEFVRFPGSMRLQQSKKEDIVELADMVKERLLAWASEHLGQLPQNVLFYRDGVSESQYDILRRRELPQIQLGMNLAYNALNPAAAAGAGSPPVALAIPYALPANPTAIQFKEHEEDIASATEEAPFNRPLNLTYIVVGKRHHTRFYPGQTGAPTTNNGNIRPGLVVDQVITHPYRMDFFLQSHLPIQGTGRSAHYVVLRNGMDLSADQIQNITHTFCYAYARATKGVSYCAPAYYADRLCDRGRSYLRRWLINSPFAPALPPKNNLETWPQYTLRMKNHIHQSQEYRPHGDHNIPNRQNPWHPNLDLTMFYL